MFFYPENLTDADIPGFKRWMVQWREDGHPLQLPPSVAAAAKLKGFEEGMHFDIIRPIPGTGEAIFKPVRMGVHG